MRYHSPLRTSLGNAITRLFGCLFAAIFPGAHLCLFKYLYPSSIFFFFFFTKVFFPNHLFSLPRLIKRFVGGVRVRQGILS